MSLVSLDGVVPKPMTWWEQDQLDAEAVAGGQVDLSDYEDEFESWRNALDFELSLLLSQPRTDENIQKIGAAVDWYFSDIMFKHLDHEVLIERDGDDIKISVMMLYEDMGVFMDDFEMMDDADLDDDFLSAEAVQELYDMAMMDGVDLTGIDRPDADLLKDAYWAIFKQITERANQEIVASDDQSNDTKRQSVEDMLFEPIEVEKKEPEKPKTNEDYIYDGCYYEG